MSAPAAAFNPHAVRSPASRHTPGASRANLLEGAHPAVVQQPPPVAMVASAPNVDDDKQLDSVRAGGTCSRC